MSTQGHRAPDPAERTSEDETAPPDVSGARPVQRPEPRRGWRRFRRPLIAAGGGAVAAFATPPIDLFPCMLIGLALLALALCDVERFWRGFAIGAAWGTAGQLIAMRFVPSVIQLFTDLGTPA